MKEIEGEKLFKILAKVESEHASIFKKILKLDKIDFPKYEKCAVDYEENLQESHEREENAIRRYAQFARETKIPRLKEIFQVLVQVETDHLQLSEERLK